MQWVPCFPLLVRLVTDQCGRTFKQHQGPGLCLQFVDVPNHFSNLTISNAKLKCIPVRVETPGDWLRSRATNQIEVSPLRDIFTELLSVRTSLYYYYFFKSDISKKRTGRCPTLRPVGPEAI